MDIGFVNLSLGQIKEMGYRFRNGSYIFVSNTIEFGH